MATVTTERRPQDRDDHADGDALYEIINGERREIAPMGAMAGTIATVLATHLNMFGLQHKMGLAMSEVLFRFRPGLSMRPDVAFVKYERWPALTATLLNDPAEFDFVPNLAVEVVSPNNTANEIEDKIKEYFDTGVELVWVVYPRHRRIYVYESAAQARVLVDPDDLEGGKVLPGFHLGVAALFDSLIKPPAAPQ